MTSGKIVAGPLVRLACKRHLEDLKHGPDRGLEWRVDLVHRAVNFFPEILRLAEGEFAGEPFALQPWQCFIVGSLFGWVGPDGYRRFRTAYIEVGKGNGKSPMAAGIGIYGMIADEEPGAQIYSAATTRDQAKIVWGDAHKMVEASPSLSSRIIKTVNNLAFPPLASFFRPVSSDASKLDGFRPHIVLADEVHEHPNDSVINKMRAGFKFRRQPLLVEITNSGVDRHSICFQHHDYSKKVLEGIVDNDSWFAFVCALDEGDDPFTDESCWIKPNPNLGVSVPHKYLREQVQEASEMPAKQNIVRRLNFCQWTEQHTRWLDMAVWDRNKQKIAESELIGRPCFGGLDLSTTTDIAACAFVFPIDDLFAVLMRYWVPELNVRKRALRDRVPYDVWIREGRITPTPGNVVDYAAIRRDINLDAERFQLIELAFDPWNATQLATELGEGDGIQMVKMRQGFESMTEPTKETERLLLADRVAHGADPVLRWMASNVSVKLDPAGNIKPDKSKSTERIDGIVALVMAIGRATLSTNGPSVYETRGIAVV